MTDTTNILSFPAAKPRTDIPTIDTVKDFEKAALDGLNAVKANHVMETISLVVPMLFNNIDLAGFPVEDDPDEDPFYKDCTLIVEAIKSLLCKHYDLKHPFQDISEAVFDYDEEGTIGMNDHINIPLRKDQLYGQEEATTDRSETGTNSEGTEVVVLDGSGPEPTTH